MDGAVDAPLADSFRPFLWPDIAPEQQALERLEAEITELWGHVNAATYRFLELVADFDRRQGWALHGLVNCAQWLNWQCGIGACAAREKVRVARALEALPKISDAFRRGAISYSKVRAMTRVATPENEDVLLNAAEYGTAAQVEKLVGRYRWVERLEESSRAQRLHRERRLYFFYDDDGSMVIRGKLPPEVGEIVKKAIEAAMALLDEDAAATRNAGAAEGNDDGGGEERGVADSETAGHAGALSPNASSAQRPAPQRGSDVSAETALQDLPAADAIEIDGRGVIQTESNVSAETSDSAPEDPTMCTMETADGVVIGQMKRNPFAETSESTLADRMTPDQIAANPARHGRPWAGVSAETSEAVLEDLTTHDPIGAKRADALRIVAEAFLARQSQVRGSVADRYQVVVHVDQRLLAGTPGLPSAIASSGGGSAPRRCGSRPTVGSASAGTSMYPPSGRRSLCSIVKRMDYGMAVEAMLWRRPQAAGVAMA
jgi:hypothetical protein